MTTDHTVEQTTDQDFAPLTAAQQAAKAGDDLSHYGQSTATQSFDTASRTDKNGKPIRSFISKGERIHNEITYRGIDWVMNSVCGVAFAYFTHRTELGRKIFTNPAESFFTKGV